MDLEVLKEIKNSRGELKTKVVRAFNQKVKKGIDFDTINDLYKELSQKYGAEAISILAKPLDGGTVTLKTPNYVGNNLKHADESYYSSKPTEHIDKIKKKLQGKYYEAQITIQC
jgi:hypothetical protein